MKKFIALLLAVVMCLGLFAACGKEEGKSDLAKAKEYLYSLYVDKSTETATDLEYPAKVKGGSTFFEVEWTVEIVSGAGEIKVVPSSNAGFVVVDVPGEPAEDIVYKLTATIKGADGKTETLVYEYTVPQFKLTTFAEYAAAADDTLLVCQGTVTSILSKTYGDSSNSLYFQDNDGGYYAYNISVDPVEAGIKVGMVVRVTGLKDTYNGTYEIVSGEAQIIDSNVNPVEPVDFTQLFLNAADLKDPTLTTQQSFLVTLKGVEITKQDDKYLKFKLGDKETYIYISSSNCPGTAEEEAAMIATYNEKSGHLANVTGMITLYNGSFYLTPANGTPFEYLGLPEKSDAEMIEYEKGNLSLPGNAYQNAEFELPTAGATYDKVVISWAVEGEGAAIVDGKLVLTIGAADSVVTVTATLTAGETTETVTFQIKLRGNSGSTTLNKADSIANGDKVVIYYPNGQLAMGAEDNGKKVTGVEAVLDGATLNAPQAAIMEVVVDENGYYTFICDGKYLTSGATGNSMVWAAEPSEFSLWVLEATEDGFYIKNVNAAYNGNAQYMEYYSGFTTYGFSDANKEDPAKTPIYTFQFFKVTEESEKTMGNGSEVMIYYAASDLYITGTANGKKLAGGTEGEAAVFTVVIDENGYYTFMVDGKYLTAGATGNSLSLEDAASEYSLWILEECENGFYVKNVNAAYNGNPQYLEYYNGFTTYGFSDANKQDPAKTPIYTFLFIVL